MPRTLTSLIQNLVDAIGQGDAAAFQRNSGAMAPGMFAMLLFM